jgi:site-specific recombinase XerD
MVSRLKCHNKVGYQFGFLMKTKLKSKKRWEVRLHQVLTQEELSKIAFANFITKEKAIRNGQRTPVLDWMIFNTSCWGLRIAESAHLKCGQIYLSKGVSHIDLRHTKGGKPRDVFIGPLFSQFIQEYLAWKASIGEPVDKHAPFFLSSATRGFMTTEGLRKAFKRAILRGDIGKTVTPHAGRHTFGTHMAQGFLKLVQKELGHASLATTEVYIHILNPQIQEFVTKYEELLYIAIRNMK